MGKPDYLGAKFRNVQVNLPTSWRVAQESHLALGALAQATLQRLHLTFGKVHVKVVADANVEIDRLHSLTNRRDAIVMVHPKQTWRFNNNNVLSDETMETIAGAAAEVMFQRTRLCRPSARQVAAVRFRAMRVARDVLRDIEKGLK